MKGPISLGVRRGGLIQLLEALNGDDFGHQIVEIGIHYMLHRRHRVKPQPLHWLSLGE